MIIAAGSLVLSISAIASMRDVGTLGGAFGVCFAAGPLELSQAVLAGSIRLAIWPG